MENDYSYSPEKYLNFHGKEWAILRAYLKCRIDSTVDQLCGDKSHEETILLRGQLRAYRDLLSLEAAAPRAAEQE